MINSKRGLGGGFQSSDTDEVFDDIPYTMRDDYAWGRPKKGLNIDFLFRGLNKGKTRLYTFVVQMLTGMTVDAARAAGGVPNVNVDYVSKLIPFKDDATHLYGTPDMITNDGLLFTLLAKPYGTSANDTSWRFSDISRAIANSIAPNSNNFFDKTDDTLREKILLFINNELAKANSTKKIKEQYEDLLKRAKYYPALLVGKELSGTSTPYPYTRYYFEFVGTKILKEDYDRLDNKLKARLSSFDASNDQDAGEDRNGYFIALSEGDSYGITSAPVPTTEQFKEKQKGEAYFRSRMVDVSDIINSTTPADTGRAAIASYFNNASAVLNSYIEFLAAKMTVYDDGRIIFDGRRPTNENIITRMNKTFLMNGRRYRIVFFEDETEISANEYPSIQKDGTINNWKIPVPVQLYFSRYKQRDINAQNTYQTFKDDLDPHIALDELHITELTAFIYRDRGRAPNIKIFTHNENNQPRAKMNKLSLVNFKSYYISDPGYLEHGYTSWWITNRLIEKNRIKNTKEVIFDISSFNNDVPAIRPFSEIENPGPIVEKVEWWDNPAGYIFKTYPSVGKPTSNIPVFSRFNYNAEVVQPANYDKLFLKGEVFNGNIPTYKRAVDLYGEKYGVTGAIYISGDRNRVSDSSPMSRFLVPNTSKYNEWNVGNNYTDILRGSLSKDFINKYSDGRIHFEWLIYPNTVKDENNRTRPMIVNFYPIDLGKALVVSRYCEKNRESMQSSERNNLILDSIKGFSDSLGINEFIGNGDRITTHDLSFYASYSNRKRSEYLDGIIPIGTDYDIRQIDKKKIIKSYLNMYFMNNPERFYQIESNKTFFSHNNPIGWMLDINRIAAVKTKANIEINVNESLASNVETADNLETFKEVDRYIHFITNNESTLEYDTMNGDRVYYIDDEKRVLQVNMPVYSKDGKYPDGYTQVNYLGDGSTNGNRGRLLGNDVDLFSPSLTIRVDDIKVMPFFDMVNVDPKIGSDGSTPRIRRRYIPHYGYGITGIKFTSYESFKKMVSIYNDPDYTDSVPIVANNTFMFDSPAYRRMRDRDLSKTERTISFIDFKILDKSGNPYKPYSFDLKDDLRVIFDYNLSNKDPALDSVTRSKTIENGDKIKLAPNFVDIIVVPEDHSSAATAYLEELFNNPKADKVGSEWDAAYSEARRLELQDYYPRYYNRRNLASGEVENTSYPVNLPTFTVYSRSFMPGISVSYNSPYLKRIFLRTATFPDLYGDYIDPRFGNTNARRFRELDTFYERRIYNSETGKVVLNYGQPIDRERYMQDGLPSVADSGKIYSYSAQYDGSNRLNDTSNPYIDDRGTLTGILNSGISDLMFSATTFDKERLKTSERNLPIRPRARIPAIDWTRVFYYKHGVMRREFYEALDLACNLETENVFSTPYTSFNLLRFPDVDCTEFNGDIKYQNGLYGSHLGIISSVGDSVQFVVICVDDDYMFDNTGTYCLSDTLDPKTNKAKREEIIYHMLFRYAPSLEFVVFCKRQHFDQIDQNRALTAADIERMNLPDVVTLDSFRRCFSGVKNRAEFKMFGVKATRKGYDQNKALATNKQLKAKLNIR